jgi:hypothetical protein
MKKVTDRSGLGAALALLLVLGAALLPGLAFAEDAKAEAEAPAAADEGAPDSLITGEVTKVEAGDGGGVAITLDDGKDGIVLNISELRFVYDRKAKAVASLDDVKEGLSIAAVLPKNAPLALSAPPQTGAVFGLILNSDAGESKLDIFDENLLSADGELKLNIDADTPIAADTGVKRVFTEEDLKNKELIVFYDTVSMSLPAQTAPSYVLILNAPTEKAPEEAAPAAEAKYVGLRAAAEAKGYTVTWVSNAQPITLQKGDITVTVTIGSDAFTYTHLTKDVQPLDSAEKLDLATRLTDGKTMVADSFIELLK